MEERGAVFGFSPASAWRVVAMLAALYALSIIDRLIVVLLVEPISAEFGIGDTQIGLLVGFGFAIVYSLAGLPLANLLDQGKRKIIVSIGAMCWGLSTIASGFAENFETLALCRAGVAIGEAVLTPAAVSLIADMFRPEKRVLPVSVYGSISVAMGVGSLIVGGAALDLATRFGADFGLAPWRGTLVLVGAPSAVLALVFLATTAEPARQKHEKSEDSADSRAFLAYFKNNLALFGVLFLGVGIASLLNFGIVSWVPTLMIRAFDVPAARAGYMFGAVGAGASLLGAFGWPMLARRVSRPGSADGALRCLMAGSLGACPFLIAAAFAPNMIVLLVVLGFACFMVSGGGVLAPLAIQSYGRTRMRARLVAVWLLSCNIIGQGMGPLIVPLAAELTPGDPRALGYGLALMASVVGPLSALLIWRSLRSAQNTPLADAAP
ncbi:MAG: MFS transporter [Hyphomonadaceae bacterium]